MASTFNTIFDKYRINPGEAKKLSTAWYNQQIKLLGKPKPSQIMRGGMSQNVGKVMIGGMYFFYYHAKHKDTLPMWDMFPLVVPFAFNTNGFTGLNFHYLPYGARIWLLDMLLGIHNQQVDSATKIKISWEKIKAVSELHIAKDAVHRYLTGHIDSPIKRVDPKDWHTALMLPVEKFVSNTGKRIKPHKVWS